jgi:hypothetical protein
MNPELAKKESPYRQVLGQHAARAKRARVRCHGKQNIDELTVTLESVAPVDLAAITAQLSAQPWVVAASIST